MLSEAFQIIQLNQKLSVFTVKNKVHIEAKKKKKDNWGGYVLNVVLQWI